MMDPQTTICEETHLEGIGLHTGNRARVVFRPTPANVGIRFFRSDLPDCPMIPARLDFVTTTLRGTNLGLGKAQVHTVEHVLSACTGLGIDNLDILVDASEPPALDGSALPFYEALLRAGIHTYRDFPKRTLRIPTEVLYRDGETFYRAQPSRCFQIRCTFAHPHPLVGRQTLEIILQPQSYLAEIAGARTFCFEEEVDMLKSAGLAKGGSLKNALVIGKNKVHADQGAMRFPDEFVRHKILDLLGDLSLTGRSLFTLKIEAFRPGHAHNIEFAKRLNAAAVHLRTKAVSSGG